MRKLKQKSTTILSLLVGLLIMITSCTNQEQSKSEDEIVAIAAKAYVYGYPMVLMDLTQKVGTNVEAPTDYSYAPVNQIGHFRQFPDDKFTAVVKPNVDTYYTIAWLDLKQEPIVLTVPATERYYLLPILDAYSNVFSVPGTRTTGTGANNFLIAGPFWKGDTPEGMSLIKAPTSLAWILGRIQVNSPEDGATMVKEIQDGYKLVPLKEFEKDYVAPKGTVSDEHTKIVPVKDIETMSIKEYFTLMAMLMVDNPTATIDSTLVGEMASIGIVPGDVFNTEAFSQELMDKLNAIPKKVDESFKQTVASKDPNQLVNGWSTSYNMEGMGNYGTDYDFRALIAYVGLGANLRQDAVYPNTALDMEGNLLDASNKYIIHFEKNAIPPVNAFWSLTVYDSRNLLAANPINRFALGDRDNLKYNADGSLNIFIQKENPGVDKESNWLPAPEEGNFELTLRLYWPKQEVLNGEWKPAPVKKVQ